MAKLFDDILEDGYRQNQIPARTSTARQWFRDQAKNIGKVNETKLFRDHSNKFENKLRIGHMYTFYYDPKLKADLPYYDRVPLIFPVGPAPGGFYGINFHYLPLKLRAHLMDSLYTITNNKRYDETTKLQISYKLLKSAEKFKWFKPAFKHYLHDHVRSRFLYIPPAQWDIALFVNFAKFQKATQTQVWNESKESVNKKTKKES